MTGITTYLTESLGFALKNHQKQTMKFSMKTILVLFSLFVFTSTYSQVQTNPNSFEINGDISEAQRAEYTLILSQANFETFRLKDEVVDLIFDEGFTLSLKPGSTMAQYGKNPDDYALEFPEYYRLPKFSISQSGIVHAKLYNPTIKE